ncbi:hypothetical protein U1Q18_051774, partial [Sarracenia purpurea var. burkii]
RRSLQSTLYFLFHRRYVLPSILYEVERKTSAHTRLRFIALLLSARSANVTAANRELRVDRAGNFFGDGRGFYKYTFE